MDRNRVRGLRRSKMVNKIGEFIMEEYYKARAEIYEILKKDNKKPIGYKSK